MEKILLHRYVIPFKGIQKKTVYHFSDSHLTEYDELSSEAETERAKKQTFAWENIRKSFAVAYNEPFGEAQAVSGREHFLNLIEQASKGDAIVIAGDMMDYVSDANLRFAEECLSKLTVPFVSVCGNHEKSTDIPENGAISVMRKPVQTVDLGDMCIFALDNSTRQIKDEQLAELQNIIDSGKPVMIAMHIPIMTKDNAPYLVNAGEYFQLNYNGCPQENLRFIDMIKENSKQVICVLAGHLHFANNSEVTEGVTQYVSSQGVTGNINVYEIGE